MNWVKYPRTNHLPWSPGMQDDDRMLQGLDSFIGKRVIVTEKMDGENTTMYRDHIHARSIDSRGGEDRAWVKQLWANIAHDIPAGWRICGENLWAKHSIQYDELKSYFYGFGVWNEKQVCLSWDDSLEYFSALGITPVPVLYDGIWDEQVIRQLEKQLDFSRVEGYVVRVANEFVVDNFKRCVGKYVRAGHVQTDKHWRLTEFIPNTLSSKI